MKSLKPIFAGLFLIGLLWFVAYNLRGCVDSISKSAAEAHEITENAYKICSIIKQNVLITDCKDNVSNSSVDVVANLNPGSAMLLCQQVKQAMIINKNWHFHGYSMRVLSPLSNGYPIAACVLPR